MVSTFGTGHVSNFENCITLENVVVMAYPIPEDGSLAAGDVLIDLTDTGMRIDLPGGPTSIRSQPR